MKAAVPRASSIQLGGRIGRWSRLAGLHHAWFELWWTDRIRHDPRFEPKTPWNDQHRAFFIHIPKTAGTSIYQSLGMTSIEYTHVPARVIRRHYPAEFSRYFVFVVVRNPWDRLVSTFEFLRHGTSWKKQQRWAEQWLGAESFESFVLKLDDDFRFRNGVLAEDFFFTQSYFTTDRWGRSLVDQIYRFEALQEAFAELTQRFGVSADLAHARQSSRRDYRSYYNDRTAEIVGRLYAADATRFGYQFDR